MKKPSWPAAILQFVIKALRWAIALVLLLFFLGPLVVSTLSLKRGNPVVDFIHTGRVYIDTVVAPFVRSTIPTKFGKEDWTVWILVAALLALFAVLGAIQVRIKRSLSRTDVRRATDQWKNKMQVPAQSRIAADLDAKIKKLQLASKHIDHQELLNIFAETKRKLDGLARDLAFLSVDVVGSTQMKDSEDPAAVQHDFFAYRKLVENVFKEHNVMKAAWTPDGVMACFPSLDDAVQAGKDIITQLVDFNRSVKLIRTDFAVRCGVNSGRVYFDDSMALEAMSERVIDVAGHMQKYAAPNTIAISRTFVEPLTGNAGFAPTQNVVDGYEVYAWSGKA